MTLPNFIKAIQFFAFNGRWDGQPPKFIRDLANELDKHTSDPALIAEAMLRRLQSINEATESNHQAYVNTCHAFNSGVHEKCPVCSCVIANPLMSHAHWCPVGYLVKKHEEDRKKFWDLCKNYNGEESCPTCGADLEEMRHEESCPIGKLETCITEMQKQYLDKSELATSLGLECGQIQKKYDTSQAFNIALQTEIRNLQFAIKALTPNTEGYGSIAINREGHPLEQPAVFGHLPTLEYILTQLLELNSYQYAIKRLQETYNRDIKLDNNGVHIVNPPNCIIDGGEFHFHFNGEFHSVPPAMFHVPEKKEPAATPTDLPILPIEGERLLPEADNTEKVCFSSRPVILKSKHTKLEHPEVYGDEDTLNFLQLELRDLAHFRQELKDRLHTKKFEGEGELSIQQQLEMALELLHQQECTIRDLRLRLDEYYKDIKVGEMLLEKEAYKRRYEREQTKLKDALDTISKARDFAKWLHTVLISKNNTPIYLHAGSPIFNKVLANWGTLLNLLTIPN